MFHKVELSKFEKFSATDTPKQRAQKIIHFMENEGGFKSSLEEDGKLNSIRKEFILQQEVKGPSRPPSHFSVAFIMSVNIARQMLSDDNPSIAKVLNVKYT